jgi:hypothetical protein
MLTVANRDSLLHVNIYNVQFPVMDRACLMHLRSIAAVSACTFCSVTGAYSTRSALAALRASSSFVPSVSRWVYGSTTAITPLNPHTRSFSTISHTLTRSCSSSCWSISTQSATPIDCMDGTFSTYFSTQCQP